MPHTIIGIEYMSRILMGILLGLSVTIKLHVHQFD